MHLRLVPGFSTPMYLSHSRSWKTRWLTHLGREVLGPGAFAVGSAQDRSHVGFYKHVLHHPLLHVHEATDVLAARWDVCGFQLVEIWTETWGCARDRQRQTGKQRSSAHVQDVLGNVRRPWQCGSSLAPVKYVNTWVRYCRTCGGPGNHRAPTSLLI